ncbi:MAG: glycoside hydrolase family 25 protein, partial [Chitinophagales bacterium]
MASLLKFTKLPSRHSRWLLGNQHKKCTAQFQRDNNLGADGIPGNGTLNVAETKGFVIPKPVEFRPEGNINAICDVSHLNGNMDFDKAKADGMLAIFHKGTQSIGHSLFHDHTYHIHKRAAQSAGLLWGAYHFGTSGSGVDQANALIDYVQPDNDTLLVLDFEKATTSGETSMTLEEAKAFIEQVKTRTGKYPGIYGGAMLKEVMRENPDPTFLKCWLWIAQYGSVPHLPNGWDTHTFWQFTDGAHGPGPLPVNGIGHCDRDVFKGTADDLKVESAQPRIIENVKGLDTSFTIIGSEVNGEAGDAA